MKQILKTNEKAFTLVEMMVVLLVITVLILIALPNVTKHSANINQKGCDALVQMVQGQVEAYRMENNSVPSIENLVTEKYLKDNDTKCPNGKAVSIGSDGRVEVSDN